MSILGTTITYFVRDANRQRAGHLQNQGLQRQIQQFFMAPCPHVLRGGRCDRSDCTYDHQKTQCSCGMTLHVQSYNAHIRGKKHKDLIKNKAPPAQPATANAGGWASSDSLPQFDRFYVDLQLLHDAMCASWTSLVRWSTMRTVAAEHTETRFCVHRAIPMPLSARLASPAHPRPPATSNAMSGTKIYIWTSVHFKLLVITTTSNASVDEVL